MLGPLGSVDRTLAALEAERPDAVLLDVGLADGHSAPVATVLAAGGLPFAFLTGADHSDLDAVSRTVPRLTKPFGSDAIEGVVLQLLGTVESGRSVEQGELSRH